VKKIICERCGGDDDVMVSMWDLSFRFLCFRWYSTSQFTPVEIFY
jgi:hypothetical protein